MRSLDTNVLLRFLLGDDPEQAPIAARILDEPAIITATVTIETFWVLRRVAGWTNAQIATAFDGLLTLSNLQFVHAEAVDWAMQRARGGADFADMLHLALSGSADSFATFDRSLARHGTGGPVPVELLG